VACNFIGADILSRDAQAGGNRWADEQKRHFIARQPSGALPQGPEVASGRLSSRYKRFLSCFIGGAIGKPASFGAKCLFFRGATLCARAPTGAGSCRESYPKIQKTG
jgi:hypothetical protein